MRLKFLVFTATLATAGALSAQQVVSAKAGLIQYIEGDVTVDGAAVAMPTQTQFAGNIPAVKQDSVLRTGLGRAEVLMAPGIFLRVAEQTEVKMISDSLEDTRLELVNGSILLEVAYLDDASNITIRYGNTSVSPRKDGLYRFDTDPAVVRVYDGEADVVAQDQATKVKKSWVMALDGSHEPEKFDTDLGDSLTRWSARRAGYVAQANVNSAQRVRTMGLMWTNAHWFYDPVMGIVTFIPLTGTYLSPYGWRYYSPSRVAEAFRTPVYSSPTRGISGFGSQSYPTTSVRPNTGYSTSVNSAPPSMSSAPAASTSSGEASVRSAAPGAVSNGGGARGR